jgi:hypothetical protein
MGLVRITLYLFLVTVSIPFEGFKILEFVIWMFSYMAHKLFDIMAR